ncbi:MAG: Hsp20/alpha crystallin family protein [Candidatus Moranbacteria bacterium]|jgi:HSP20 family protein|nr:Hsp20/alpha crystallin family protein [Candidatus Moranbacteria bacterium]
MVTKEKKSFFERLTGAQRMDENETAGASLPIYEEEETTQFSLHTNDEPAMPVTQPSWSSPSYQPQAAPQTMPENNDIEGQLTIDVYQTENEIVIKSTIAGVKPEDLDVTINNDMVTVKGERKNEEVVEQGNYYYQECYWGGFSRSVLLPVDVIPEKADASLKNGILTIRLPKADTTKVKKILVRGF